MNYIKIYENIITRAKSRTLFGYKESHHIIPRCMNGSDEPINLVDLTAKEHFICHLLLAKTYNIHGLWTAVWMMSNKHRINSRIYELIRKEFSKRHSEYMKGKSFATFESKLKGLETKRRNGTLNMSEDTKKKISDATKGRVIVTTPEKRIKNSIDSKDRRWVNNGIDSSMVKGEKLNELLASGWVLGRLRTPTLIEGAKKGGSMTGGHNKGIPMSPEQKIKCEKSFFKKGQASHNKKKS